MEQFNHTLSDGRLVNIIKVSPNNWGYEIYSEGELLGMIHTDGGEITEDEVLKPFEDELLQVIHDQIRTD